MNTRKRVTRALLAILCLLLVREAADAGRRNSLEPPESPVVGDSLNIRRVGRGLHELLEPVFVEEGVAFLGSYTDILAVDVTNPETPSIIASHPVPAETPYDISVESGYVYAAYGDSGVFIYRYSDTGGFAYQGSYNPGGTIWTVHAQDSLLYVNPEGTLHILDVRDPTHPALLDTFNCGEPRSVWHLIVEETLCYAACTDGLVILDLSDPSQVEVIDASDAVWAGRMIAKSGDIVYFSSTGRLRSIDVSDVENPVVLDILTVPSNMDDIAYFDNLVYVSDSHGGEVHIIDVSNPEEMFVTTTIELKGNVARSKLSLDYPLLYVTDGEGLQIFDVSDPENPVKIGFYDGEFFLRNVDIEGNYAYLCDYTSNNLRVVDITDRRLPREVGTAELKGAYDVDVDGNLAYVASDSTGLDIFDVSDPSNIEHLGNYDTVARGVVARYPLAYIASSRIMNEEGLRILDVSDPDSIVELSFYETFFGEDVFVDGNRAYLAMAFVGVRVFDVTDPGNPTVYSYIPSYDYAEDVAAYGDYVYIAEGYAGLRVIDISDPGNPVQTAQSLVQYGSHLFLKYPLIYVSGSSRITVYNISQPDTLEEIAHYELVSFKGMYVDDEYIYTGTADHGFYVMSLAMVGIEGGRTGHPAVPTGFSLSQNYPNPFNPATMVEFTVPGEEGERSAVRLDIYDVRGRLVRNLVDEVKEPGTYRISWDGRDDAGMERGSGIYFCRITAGDFRATRKLVLVE